MPGSKQGGRDSGAAHAATARREPLVFPLALPGSGLRRRAKIGIGALVLLVRPGLAARFEAGEAPRSWLERAALAALITRYRKAGTLDRLVQQHARFWASDASLPFYQRTSSRLQGMFHGDHQPLAEAVENLLAHESFHTLCEIGCGSGVVLAHFASRLPGITRFVGIDLNAAQIERNTQAFAGDPRLEFVAGDAFDWISQHARPGMAYFVYGGVLEYFTQARLQALLELIARQSPVCIALAEPLAKDHDIDAEPVSRPHGFELSNSHPYPRLMTDAGLTVVWRRECVSVNTRWLMLVAQR